MGNKLGLLNFLATWLWAFPNTAIKLNLDDYLYGKQLCLEFQVLLSFMAMPGIDLMHSLFATSNDDLWIAEDDSG
jgi:hypothetical protein